MYEIHTNSPEGIKVQINDHDVTDIQAVLEGPGKCVVTLNFWPNSFFIRSTASILTNVLLSLQLVLHMLVACFV